MQEQILCNRCGKKFTQNGSLLQHERDKHNLERCQQCGKTFDRKKALKNHFWFNHRMRRKGEMLRRKKKENPIRIPISKERIITKIKQKNQLTGVWIDNTPSNISDEERRELLRDWRELGK